MLDEIFFHHGIEMMAGDVKRAPVWKNLLLIGYCALWHTAEGWLLKGSVVGILENHRPVPANDEVHCDEKRRTYGVQVERTIGRDAKQP